jgi:hypothetical protein
MIRPERFAVSRETFAAERRDILTRTEETIRAAVHASVTRMGLPGWDENIVSAALDVFDQIVAYESEEPGQVIDDMRDAFELELREALGKTKRSPERDRQTETLTRWVSAYAVNAGTEASTTADPDPNVGLEWVTMGDDHVRSSHREAAGQTVPAGQAFEVNGVEMFYPGQPVGDPENWINCRCTVAPAMLGELAAKTVTAAGTGNASDPGLEPGEEPSAAVVVALPREGDAVRDIASGTDPHCTLLYLGDGTVDLSELCDVVAAVAKGTGHPMTDKVSGRAVLGKDNADVLLLDASGSGVLRAQLLTDPVVKELLGMQEQFPAWIPHLTLGYPEAPADEDPDGAPLDVTYDRLAVWRGDEVYEFPLGEEMPEPEPVGRPTDFAVSRETETETGEFSAEEMAAGLADEAYPQVPWHGLLAPEGKPSGDGRMFSANALTHRALPLPIKAMFTDDEGHKGSVVVGRIDRLVRKDGAVWGEGVFDTSPAAYEALRQVAEGMWRGVSVDVDDVVAAADSEVMEFASARIASATLCAIPAFAEAFVALGPLPEDNDAPAETETPEKFDLAPARTKDGPGWITEPKPTQRITGYWVDGRGAAKIGWGAPGDFNRCRTQLAKYVQNPEWLAGLCANLHYRALGVWPGQANVRTEAMSLTASADTAPAESVSLVAAADTPTLPADWFRDPGFEGPHPFTVTDEGRVFGHVATWDVCHIGIGDACVTAPHSEMNYAYFLTGEVFTDAGAVPVGQITLGGGHADLRKGVRAALAHYDETGSAAADVTVGEDEFGIWVAGALREGLSAKQIRELRGAALSGDWRGVRMRNGEPQLEMVAALAVNVPGFPIPRTALAASAGTQTSLVAASIVENTSVVTDADIDARVEAVLAKRERSAKLAAIKQEVRTFRVGQIKKNFNK